MRAASLPQHDVSFLSSCLICSLPSGSVSYKKVQVNVASSRVGGDDTKDVHPLPIVWVPVVPRLVHGSCSTRCFDYY